MLQELASRRPRLAFVLAYYGGMLGAIGLALGVPGLLVLVSQYLYGGPPPWWR